ncbi:MAG TPA: hypothetical protein PKE63_01865 [Lacibacter sp.]|nr:hypothetical protein [Lacibacter sp.]HMO89903.1 hypothetical protein [Lacibacter sp.]HMP85990.1 hypothetical protein [Lacibacter sp.]
MKQFLLLIFLFGASAAFSQLKTTTSSIRSYLDQVVDAYPYGFSNLKGERLGSDPNTIAFSSSLVLPGALETQVLGYPGKRKTYWVWECKYRELEDFDAFKKMYRAVYNDIAGGAVVKNPNSRYVSAMPYEAPTETQRLWSNQFRLNEKLAPHSNLVIDLVAENVGFVWVIWLRVYDKERDTDMRPTEPE